MRCMYACTYVCTYVRTIHQTEHGVLLCVLSRFSLFFFFFLRWDRIGSDRIRWEGDLSIWDT